MLVCSRDFRDNMRKQNIMRSVDVVVIGGSAAGIAAAITCRRHYPEKSVLIVRKEKQAHPLWDSIYLWDSG